MEKYPVSALISGNYSAVPFHATDNSACLFKLQMFLSI